jgi:hypothetical protein
MKTIRGIEIKAKSNKSNKTFTIRKQGLKFRTDKMNKADFESNENNTANDWQDFLNHSNSYQLIKK